MTAYKTCKACNLTTGQRIVNRMGDVMEVTAVVVGNVKSRYGYGVGEVQADDAGHDRPAR